MLVDFVERHRDSIIARTRTRVAAREWPAVSTDELELGVPLFLSQLAATLRAEQAASPRPQGEIEHAAARHGGGLRSSGFSVSQVVHDYGEICQSVADVAINTGTEIATADFRTLNHCLDVAIASAVTEYARITAAERTTGETERLGQIAHELRNNLNSGLLAYAALKRGTVGINGTTGAVLGRSLLALRAVVDRSLAEVRLASGTTRSETVSVRVLLDETAQSAALDAETRTVRFRVEEVPDNATVIGDPQLLASAVMNLLQNAFKFTPAGGQVTLRASLDGADLLIEVEDECGGLPDGFGATISTFAERRGTDRSGMGLGLTIVRKSIRAHGGKLTNRNQGKGCVFCIRLPTAGGELSDV